MPLSPLLLPLLAAIITIFCRRAIATLTDDDFAIDTAPRLILRRITS